MKNLTIVLLRTVLSVLAWITLSESQHLGINDSVALVGRLFNATIPEDAYGHPGGPLRFEVSEAGKQKLPRWLYFDENTRSFLGVPLEEDIGQSYISITTYPTKEKDGLPSMTKDVFSIEVTDTGPNLCHEIGELKMAVSVVVNSPPKLPPVDRVKMLVAVTSFLNVNSDGVQLSEVNDKESALDPRATRAGSGDAERRDPHTSLLQFPVACGGQLTPLDETFVSVIEKSAADGTLSDAIGHRIVGWQLIETSARRQKRYVTPYRGTPIPWVRATLFPVVTERFFESTSEATPESRIVPTMSSPDLVPPTQPLPSHSHRHHHHYQESATLRRQPMPAPTTDVRATPTWRYHTVTTYLPPSGTPMPTPPVYPERATALVPSRIPIGDPTVTIFPTLGPMPSSDVVSRWYEATSDFATAILPTRSRTTTVEPTRTQPQNFKPTINNRMKKLSLVCGKAWSYVVPSDTFYDLEDGNTRALKLMFTTSERTSISAFSWIQFDPEHQTLYALPLSDNIGRHEYVLEAMDKEGASTYDRVELHVWPHPGIESLSHALSMTVRYNKWQYPVGIDWQIEIINRLSVFFGDPDNSRLVLLSITLDPVRITWANDSFPSTPCPLEPIRQIYETIAEADHHPTREMKKLMLPEFRVQEITVEYRGSCEGVVTSPPPLPNSMPKLMKPIKRINVTAGDVLRFEIPADTFYDFEDTNTRGLKLSLLSSEDLQLPKSSWIQFDSVKQELFGIASEEDTGRQKYKLIAMDRDGHAVTDTFEVQVQRLAHRKKPPVEFSIVFQNDFDSFMADAAKRARVAFKIAKLYGDSDTEHVLIRSITRGSVVYAWSNKTLSPDQCPNELITLLGNYIINPDKTPTIALIRIMEPEFQVAQAGFVGTGVCAKIVPTFVPATFIPITIPVSPVPERPYSTVKPVTTTDDVFVTTLLPALVIVAILIVAAVVAYCLYWKKRKGGDKAAALEIDKEFVGGGVPVVFASELEEQKPDPGKTPAIMPNEKPPLSTDYLLNPLRRGAAAVRDSMAGHHHEPESPPAMIHHHHHPHQQQQRHHPHHERPMTEKSRDRRRDPRDEAASLYEPPPPFAHGREMKNNRPRASTSYSRHPTYVPP